jgi:hypothetical protein
MRLVLAATETKLRELKTLGRRLLVLRRRVIPFLALSALQSHNFTHRNLPILFLVLSSQFPVLSFFFAQSEASAVPMLQLRTDDQELTTAT